MKSKFVTLSALALLAILLTGCTSNTSSSTDTSTNETKTFTNTEVAEHNDKSSCWLIISGKVYDVTEFIPEHPGGSVIAEYCGKDATTAFQTQGGTGGRHSSSAINAILPDYLIGELKN